jgi:NAD(P)H-hydrate epimerase
MRVTVSIDLEACELREPFQTQLRRTGEEDGIRFRHLARASLDRELARADVAIDGIFGTGFHGVPEGAWAEAISALNASDVPVVAVDIPSGVNGDTGAVEGDAVWAAITVTFGALKPGVVLLPGAERAGVVEVAEIGFPPDLVRSDLRMVEEADVAGLLPSRPVETHKRASGTVLVIGGSRVFTGAVCLAAEAAYRAGAGLVAVAVPEGILPVVQAHLTEPTYIPLPQTADGTIAHAAGAVLTEHLERAHAVALGPGVTTNDQTASFVRTLARTCPVPFVLDADGLNAFAGRAGELAERRSEAILTPHAGEFARLAGSTARDVEADRVGAVRKLAAEVQATVLLKGSRTLIGTPDGEVRINPTGGPVLATGGTGDVLTGAIAGLLARGLRPLDAATAAAWVHGVAGTLAGIEHGEGTTAGDVLAHLASAIGRASAP